jgi:flagellar hook-associated protein 3 FlgL
MVPIADDTSVQTNTSGAQLFNMNGSADSSLPDVFTTLDQLAQAVTNGDETGIQSGISQLAQQTARVTQLAANTGMVTQQVTSASNQLTQSSSTMTTALSNIQDTDLPSVVVNLQEQQNALQAMSYVASTLSQGGLLSYLH